ncbi:Outer membrane protein assembly factor BamA [Pustulibacterium marinum]|uniref:Outer membrane protein assembly factor BamA n=1 Tax=Pustulibacterium marinum TaxID=1224947 RepID=A0A1I7EYN1_9FLAO|nr:metallophosphoesterase [Pustulibacterium marinum]SFU29043.1 Outer membrane protein assembly factor BamA [Pustulibacterium marinum]
MGKKSYLIFGFILIVFNSCATYEAQYLDKDKVTVYPYHKKVEKRIFLIGDAGNAPMDDTTLGMEAAQKVLDTNTAESAVIFLGDNIYPAGMPKKKDEGRKLAEHRLDIQVEPFKNFEGEIVVIPGNHDWYDHGLDGLERQEDYLNDMFKDKQVFYPENGCGLSEMDISENVHLIIVDSQWFLEDWDQHPNMNDKCPIKTRKKFFTEVETMIKNSQEKTIVFALHHPLYTNGPHGGQFALEKHLFPFQSSIPMPGIASLITLVRKSGGISIQDRINQRYNEMADRLLTITRARNPERIIFVSGHEHSLQYTKDDYIAEIVSGSGSKTSATKITEHAQFTYGKQGFALLDIFEDGSSFVRYYSAEDDDTKVIFQTQVHEPIHKDFYNVDSLPKSFPKTIQAAVYPLEDTDKTEFYEDVWGEHYRHVYSKPITANVAQLDTLYGGLEVVRAGGGHQSVTLRLRDKEGKEYNMRALEKSATQYLQAVAFKDTYVKDDLENTFPQRVLKDFYTAAHPYGAFVIPTLSDAVGVYHTNPHLYYIPKQRALGDFNENYGGKLYMIEERPMDAYTNLESFGSPDDLDSTDTMFENLREDEKWSLDEEAYIKARLFDMLIGDWDRHEDQWRWSQFDNEDGTSVYRPIPRDRDQVFSNYDGTLLGAARAMVTNAQMLQKYGGELNDLEWFNKEPMHMDVILLQNSTKQDWLDQAKFIQENMTDEAIEEAFKHLPKEIYEDASTEVIIKKMKARRANLVDIAGRYADIVNTIAIIKGTDKDDIFDIDRSGNGETTVKVYRSIDGERKKKMVDKVFNKDVTKEIWIYGLDDKDEFNITGTGKHPIKVRIVGGQNNDKYTVENGKKVALYDFKTKKITVEKKGGANLHLTNNYELNIFDYQKDKYTTNATFPSIGFNPDDGISLGAKFTKTFYGFDNNPFTARHSLAVQYFFATSGYQILYNGEIANIANKVNFIFGAHMTGPNFAQNFFGYGSDTPNNDDDLDFDYNRVKIRQLEGYVGLIRRSNYGSNFQVKAKFNAAEVDKTAGRFIDNYDASEDFFNWQYFTTLEANYSFESYDNKLIPGRGMVFNLTPGFTANTNDLGRNFGYLKSNVEFFNAISRNKRLVLRSAVATHLIFGDDFEFYQAANLGSDTGLRGFRTERFTGKNSLVFNEDLRYDLGEVRTRFLPLKLGVLAGFDVGRVWVENDLSGDKWQNSYGGGMWVNLLDALNTDLMLFHSDDGLRFTFAFGFKF